MLLTKYLNTKVQTEEDNVQLRFMERSRKSDKANHALVQTEEDNVQLRFMERLSRAAMERLKVLKSHIQNCKGRSTILLRPCSFAEAGDSAHLQTELQRINVQHIEVNSAPVNLEVQYRAILTPQAVKFVGELVEEFDEQVTQMLRNRILKKLHLDQTNSLPDFSPKTEHIRHGNWTVSPVPKRLQCRHVDLGDVSPSNTKHFVEALKSTAQGIQTDFDDGHCPTWSNQLQGMYNIYQAVRNEIKGVPDIRKAPVLMLRPRAWNMVEHNLLVKGKEVPGPLFDFGLLMFHNAQIFLENESGPYFYLSKLEGSQEAALWDRIFTWTERKLSLPHGCTKACVLIENVLATFEMHEILYELRDHSLGLNCGIWDYSASFINKFGHRKEFVLPDRNKYVSMDRHFLKSYMDLVIKTCHSRGCHATGGMAAALLPNCPPADPSYQQILNKVMSAKKKEINAGADGFMVYDQRLVKPAQELFRSLAPQENQLLVKRDDVNVNSQDLLLMPSGGVTLAGLKHNIAVGILFIEAWLRGQGHYYMNGVVEDSATAEISRSQVWQWIRHQATLEDDGSVITMAMVQSLLKEEVEASWWRKENSTQFVTHSDRERLTTAAMMFEEIITKKDFPEFITTYLNLSHVYLKSQSNFC